MKTKYKFNSKIYWILCLVLIVAMVGIVAGLGNNVVQASQLTLSGELKAEYFVGDELNVPTATIKGNNNEDLETSYVVTFPSGKAIVKSNVVLSEAGRYTITYTAKSDSSISNSVTIDALNHMWSFTGDAKSSATYSTRYDRSGLLVNLVEGESMVLNASLDLSNATQADTFIQFFSAPTDAERVEHKKIRIKLTDIENPDCYVTLLNQGSLEEWAYTLVGGNGQSMVGREDATRLHTDNQWGCYSNYRYFGTGSPALGTSTIAYSYDAAEKAFYCGGKIIADLDDPSYYSTLWSGFTSGKVRVTVTCDEYYAESANVMFLKLGEFDLNGTKVVDTDAPVIKIDDMGLDTLPLGASGYKYPVFSATAVDSITGICDVDVKVYRKISDTLINVPIEDGYFNIKHDGIYLIRYSAEDTYGNLAVKDLYITADSRNVASPSVALADEKIQSGYVGEKIKVADFAVSGGSGSVSAICEVFLGTEKFAVTDGHFAPTKAGDYKVRYTATDTIGQIDLTEYTVAVSVSDVPVFAEEPILPLYFIGGSRYTFDDVFATDYKNNETKVVATVKVTDANGEKTIASGQYYVPEVANNLDTIKVEYIAGSAKLTYEVPCIIGKQDGFIQFSNYFVGEGINVSTEFDGVHITASSANGGWTFAKKQSVDDFSLQIGSTANSPAFDGIEFTFVDAYDANIRVDVKLLRSGNKTLMQIGSQFLSYAFDWNTKGLLTVALDGNSVYCGSSSLILNEDSNGNIFDGFPSGCVIVSGRFIGATTGANYIVDSISNQKLNNDGKDNLAPLIKLLGDSGGSYKVNETAIIAPAVALDVLSEGINFTVSVYDSNYAVLTSVDGVKLEGVSPSRAYEILLTSVGRYYISYTATDESGCSAQYPLSLSVIDDQKPVINVVGKYDTTATKDTYVDFAEVEVTDNVTESDNIRLYAVIITPDGEKVFVDYGNGDTGFTPSQAGKYIVQIIAMDREGNMQTFSYTLDVQ